MEKMILLVDDEPDIREALDLYLRFLGYTVFAAENGEKALVEFRKCRPPIVFSDIKMPGMDGIELLQKIKKESPETEVIMITGHGDMDLAVKCLQYEATDFITKPIQDNAIEIALKRAWERISLRRQLQAYTQHLEKMVEEKTAKLLETERLAAVGQAVLGLSAAMGHIAGDINYFNELPCFVSIHSRDLKVVAANQLYTERLGNDVGGSSWAIYGSKARQGGACPVGETFKTGVGQRSRQTIVYADGSRLPVMVHTAPIRSRNGAPELVIEISADISEVQRLQEELRTTQQRYQQLFDEAPCFITVQDRQLKLTGTNRQFKEAFGQGVGRHCFDVYRHRDKACDNCPVVKTFADGQPHQAEMVVTSKAGEQYNVLSWTAPIRNAAGEITQVMELSTNITQLRRLQEHLMTLGLLIGSVSHGVKGILTGMDAGLYLLETGFAQEKSDRVEEGLEVVNLMVDRIRSLVSNILYYAKNRELNWETTDVSGFVNEVAFIVEPKPRNQRCEFVRDFRQPLGEFEIDRGVLRSALINILENAIEACMEDASDKHHRVLFGARQENAFVVFDILDNGIGMDPETRQNIFNLFFSSKGHAGTGLGLFIAGRIIQQHGGTVSVESSPGQGAHFVVRLPKVLPEQAKVAPDSPETESATLR
ncbi:MAG: response regulator [Candidatus Aminicenantes bacterium]|nr:response regulator [Candidatus Aminicenantes bacterium]